MRQHFEEGNRQLLNIGVKKGRGGNVNRDELDPRNYRAKAQGPKKNFEPWLSITEHSAEHYGLLVAYYRASGLAPPTSRPKSK